MYSLSIFESFFFQGLMSGWLTEYSYTCQPVDYSDSPNGTRVNLLHFILNVTLFCQ